MLASMGGMRVVITGAVLAATVALGVGADPASAAVPVLADNALVIPGADASGWAPEILAPLNPWAPGGAYLPLINARYYDCGGCAVSIVDYPRTAGPLYGPFAPYADESIAIGSASVLTGLLGTTGDTVVAGLSLGAMTADVAQRALDSDPNRPPADRVTFVVAGDPTRATPLSTGIGSFLPVGFGVPVLGWTVTRPDRESPYDTVVIVGEYDVFADFPDRPWNLLAVLNAVVAFNYTHSEAALSDPAAIPAENITTQTNSTGATTTTYLVPRPELPLVSQFRGLLPEPILAAANGFLKPLVDRGYSRYDTLTGNRAPHLRPTDGLPVLVRRAAGTGASRAPSGRVGHQPPPLRRAAATSSGRSERSAGRSVR